MENGYNLWSSHGRPLGHVKHEKFFQFIWRPRPPSLLTEAQEKEIRKDLRTYSKKYEEEDRKLKLSMQGDRLKQRRQQHADFEIFIQQMNAIFLAEKQVRPCVEAHLSWHCTGAVACADDDQALVLFLLVSVRQNTHYLLLRARDRTNASRTLSADAL